MGHYTDEREGPPMRKRLSAAQKHRESEKKRRHAVMYGRPPKKELSDRAKAIEQQITRLNARAAEDVSVTLRLPGFVAADVMRYADEWTRQMRTRKGWENLAEFRLEQILLAMIRDWLAQKKALDAARRAVPECLR